jgi:two-component system OmpR family response regulator
MLDQQPHATSTRVLCVGADAYLTDLLRYALTREGYAVQVASSGGEALAAAERCCPHAAVIDGDLPDLAGDAIGAQLGERHGTVVLLLTAGAGEDGPAPGPLRVGSRHLPKPFDLRTLIGTLDAMLRPAETPR